MLSLPLRNDAAHFGYQIELEGTTFGLDFRWNSRESSWYWSLLDEGSEPLLASLRVVVRNLYLWRYRRLGLPRGEFFFEDTTNGDREPGLKDLGNRVLFFYVPSTEFPEGFAL